MPETSIEMTQTTRATNSTTTPRTEPALVPIRAFRTPVRGYAFAAPPRGGVAAEAGVAAELVREPGNPADPLAVAVWACPSSGARWRIGYLDRGVAARLAPRMDAGAQLRARLDGWSDEPEGRWRRPLLLLLPEEVSAVSSAPDDQLRDATPPRPTAGPTVASEPTRRATGVWGRPPGVRRRRVS